MYMLKIWNMLEILKPNTQNKYAYVSQVSGHYSKHSKNGKKIFLKQIAKLSLSQSFQFLAATADP